MNEHYQCPMCGDVKTESEILIDVENGGLPYCYCMYDDNRQMIGYKKISKKKYLEIKSNKK